MSQYLGIYAVFERLGVPAGVVRQLSEVLGARRCRFRTMHGLGEESRNPIAVSKRPFPSTAPLCMNTHAAA